MPKSISFPAQNYDTPSTPPIFQLHNDIVWYIFSINADMEQDSEEYVPALLTLRNTSQVCSKWRQLALASPSLWARVLNFNSLSQRRDAWRKEVFRRTGTVPLHIRAVDRESEPQGDRYSLEWMLDNHWTRIQSLVIQLEWTYHQGDEDRWDIFECPAPSLEFFKFSWDACPYYFTEPDFALFCDTATSLRTLDVANMSLELSALSSPALRNLALHSEISAPEFLRSLSNLPLLESLEVRAHNSSDPIIIKGSPETPLLHITLPRLMSIKFYGSDAVNISLSLQVLTHIIPANGCALDFYGCYYNDEESPTVDSLHLYRRVLSTYSGYCTELETANKLRVALDGETSRFKFTFPSNRRFGFGITTGTIDHYIQTTSTLLDSLSRLQLNKITALHLLLANSDTLLSTTNFAKFILTLVSVERLETNTQSLKALKLIQDTKVVTFPALKDIHLGRVYQLSEIIDFFDSRLEIGTPEKMPTLWIGTGSIEDLKPLEKFQALRVQRTEADDSFEDSIYSCW